MNRILNFLQKRLSVMLVLVAVVLHCGLVDAADTRTGAEQLLAKFPAMKAKLEKNQFGAPIYLDSADTGGSVRVDMYGVFNHPFELIRDAVQNPLNWCDITSLHINIKACTSKKTGDQLLLTLYSGRKYYQPPADAYPLKLKFRIVSQQPQYFDIALAADEGPLHTKDHRIKLEAAPLDAARTFLHFSYSYRSGAMARLAIKSYFSTIARDKVGFSIVREDGKNVYIDGVRGAIERNTMRYYLALETYIDTLSLPQGQRLEQRLNRWYDLTAKYPRQLKEMEKAEYLANKRREHDNQLALQKKEAKVEAELEEVTDEVEADDAGQGALQGAEGG